MQDFPAAADSLGHIGVTSYARKLAGALAADGNTQAQQQFLSDSAATLERRGVLPEVVQALRQSASSD
jgi:ketopantoate hydroxymethyltransferase